MFLAWFDANRMYHGGRDLTYSEFPTRFVYYKDETRWKPRQVGDQIGRLQYTPPGVGDLYYLRLLLTRQRGCMSYKCLRTVNGRTYDMYKEACYALDLLADDTEFIDAIVEASEMYSGHQLRSLFVYLILEGDTYRCQVFCLSF
ncbi:ATP-dependent DNA helicase PIF1 [Trifolium medium]|uniref:ATP-dependent DNA helicase PIF1 n=1 Tax=Trifolium medium TaxID=97028 RepID=A0A392Q3Z8_9FABA|nr:ATP-dependent DNA helicase PIF1 [Trifolium medium]